jgi:hypothetical protein
MLNDREVGDIKEFVYWASRTSEVYFSEEAETNAAKLLMRVSGFVTPECREALTVAWRDHRYGGDKTNLGRVAELVMERMKQRRYNSAPIV